MKINSFILIALLSFSGCTQGPNQKILATGKKLYKETIQNSRPDRQESFSSILTSLSPLLNENAYTGPEDIKNRKDTMFKASVLMAAVLDQLNYEKDARTLFMNAYLLSYAQGQDAALHELKAYLPEKKDFSVYESIKLPAYTVETIKSDTGDKISYTHKITLTDRHTDVILEGVCGDIFYKMKENSEDIQSVYFNLFLGQKQIARGSWDKTEDRIILKRM